MRKKKIVAAAFMLIFLMLMAGCGENSSFLGGGGEEQVPSVTSWDISLPIERMRTLNPIVAKDEDAYYMNKLIYEGLFRLDENLKVVPLLAERYTYHEENNSVTIYLKKGIKWHDGENFTAKDVKFSLDAYLSAAAANQTLYSSYVQNISSVSLAKNNDHQLTINFKSNASASVANLTFPIIPQHRFKSVEAAKNEKASFIPVGTGPYLIGEFNEMTNIVLVGNERYHGGYVPKNTLHFAVMPNKINAYQLMEVEQISLAFSKELNRETLYANQNLQVISFPSNEVEVVGFSFKHSPLEEKLVRQAIASAINTQEILDGAYFKNGILNDTIYYPNFLGVQSGKSKYDFDPARGKLLLAEAGYTDKNDDGWVENENGQHLSIRILVNEDDQSRMAAAEMIKSGLEKIAVQSVILAKDWKSYQTDLANGNFDLFVGGFQLQETYDLRGLLHSSYGNVLGYNNADLDLLLDRMASGIEEEGRIEAFQQVKKELAEELPYFCLLYKTYGVAFSPSVQGEVRPFFHDLYRGSEKWFRVYPQVVQEPKAGQGD